MSSILIRPVAIINFCMAILLIIAVVALPGCQKQAAKPAVNRAIQQPPPLHPANGYRYHHVFYGITLVFDESFGVYRVEGHRNLYFYNGNYYRPLSNGRFNVSSYYQGPWHEESATVPVSLRNRIWDIRQQRAASKRAEHLRALKKRRKSRDELNRISRRYKRMEAKRKSQQRIKALREQQKIDREANQSQRDMSSQQQRRDLLEKRRQYDAREKLRRQRKDREEWRRLQKKKAEERQRNR